MAWPISVAIDLLVVAEEVRGDDGLAEVVRLHRDVVEEPGPSAADVVDRHQDVDGLAAVLAALDVPQPLSFFVVRVDLDDAGAVSFSMSSQS
ncbi:hypothetical protein GS528_16070 [Rhodococcus hoagii]|nr:hypothetical protein [Prescottella equi]